MKKQITRILAFTLIVAASGSVHADALDNVVIDEYGVGTWVDTDNQLHEFTGTFTKDPSGGMANALVYLTPFTFDVQGDYKLFKPNTSELVGVVRFYGNNNMIFYDNDVGFDPSPADGSGMPGDSMPFQMSLFQTLIGDPVSGTVVTPIAGMAGYVGLTRQYTFLSVLPVPEPGALSLLACSAVLLALRRKRPVG
jgi:hypothetical protein